MVCNDDEYLNASSPSQLLTFFFFIKFPFISKFYHLSLKKREIKGALWLQGNLQLREKPSLSSYHPRGTPRNRCEQSVDGRICIVLRGRTWGQGGRRAMEVITLNRIPGKDTIIYSQNQFRVNTAFRYLQDSAGVFLLDFSRLQMCFLTHIWPPVSNKLTAEKKNWKEKGPCLKSAFSVYCNKILDLSAKVKNYHYKV